MYLSEQTPQKKTEELKATLDTGVPRTAEGEGPARSLNHGAASSCTAPGPVPDSVSARRERKMGKNFALLGGREDG